MLLMGECAGSQCPLSLINLPSHLEYGVINGTYEGPHGGMFRDHLFGFLCMLSLGATSTFFPSSWRLHHGAEAPMRRVPTPTCGWWSSLGVPSSIHQERSDSTESCLCCSWNNQCVGQNPVPSLLGW